MSSVQLEYDRRELLADEPVAEPLVVAGVRCHGGFLADGTYVSPRTRHRVPAIAAWQEHHRTTFGTEILHAPVETWPGSYPNLAQGRFLLANGVQQPIVAALTRIGTVEGFGAMIRYLAPEDMQPFFVEDVSGTAVAHLGRGLVEAHARDEAGWDDEAGHDRMWFAARDIAFEHPVTEDQTEAMLRRMGIGGNGGGAVTAEERAARFDAMRLFRDLDPGLEMLVTTMTRVLFIEIKAFHLFAWAEALLADTGLVAGEGEAARIVSHIRADETPHVEYLRTALTEMRDRTFVGLSGARLPGTQVVGAIWDACLQASLGVLEEQGRQALAAEVALALADRRRGDDLLEEYHRLGDWRPSPVADPR